MNEDVYILPVACMNCDWEGQLTLKKGEEFGKFSSYNPCPTCGCDTLTKRHTIKWNEDKYFMRDLGDDRMLCMVGSDYKKDKDSLGD